MEIGFKRQILGILALLVLAGAASAAKVGLVIEFPDNTTHTECVDVENETDGYALLQESSLSLEFDDYGSSGHFIRCIRGLCTAKVGPGDWDYAYWTRYDRLAGRSSWSWSTGSLDGASQPYFAEEGDTLGFVYGVSGSMTSKKSFNDICYPKEEGGGHVFIPKILGMAVLPAEPAVGDEVRLWFRDNKTERPVRGAVVDVFDGVVGISTPIATAQSNYTGEVAFTFNRTGRFVLSVTGTSYPHEYVEVNVTAATTTTSTTSTTTTSTTTTVYIAPRHFLEGATTSTVKTTTTTQEEPAIIGMASATEEQDKGLFDSLMEWARSLF